MSKFVRVTETRYNDSMLLNIDNIVTIDFKHNHVMVNGVRGEGHSNSGFDDESMERLFVAIKGVDSTVTDMPKSSSKPASGTKEAQS